MIMMNFCNFKKNLLTWNFKLAADDEQQLIDLSIAHIKCFAHTLDLAAQKALSVSSDSLANVQKVVKYFRKSALAGAILIQI